MVLVPEHVKKMLKKPLGEVHTSYEDIMALSKKYRVVSVGDITTLALLAMDIKPHLAVFDHMVMREKLKEQNVNMLRLAFGKVKKFKNKPGTISDDLLKSAGALVREGGAVLIDGEEDLTALAFIRHANNKTVVMYGQPAKGVVVVMPTKKTKALVEKIFMLISKKGAVHKKQKKSVTTKKKKQARKKPKAAKRSKTVH